MTTPDKAVLPGALESVGGFVWWYADLLDERGNGVVVIPSWGLPFLPGYAAAARSGKGVQACSRPSLALSIYKQGRPAFYLLQETAPESASATGHHVRFGDSEFLFENGSLRATLDLPVSGGRLEGTIVVDGSARLGNSASPLDHAGHEWCPMAGPAHGSWDLAVGQHRYHGQGTAYLDRNAGTDLLEHLGVETWTWGRAVLEDRVRIGYALWGAGEQQGAILVDILADGTTLAREVQVRTEGRRTNLWGLPFWDEVHLEAEDATLCMRVRHRPDDSPFYQRSISEMETDLGTCMGFAEVCASRRIDRAWQRPLVAMCVHHTHQPNSMWLPLFSGPAHGRVARLFGSRT